MVSWGKAAFEASRGKVAWTGNRGIGEILGIGEM